MKTRYELECICKTCNLSFVIYDKWLSRLTEVGSGTHIGKFVCPNCQRTDLDFDVVVRKVNK